MTFDVKMQDHIFSRSALICPPFVTTVKDSNQEKNISRKIMLLIWLLPWA